MGATYWAKGSKIRHRAKVRICGVCNKKFIASWEQNGRFGGKLKIPKYCSRKCWNVRGRVERPCKYCGKVVISYKSTDKKYCNNQCRNLDYRVRQQGSNSHFWKGGKTKEQKVIRTSARYRDWREAVFKRDNWTCQECGSKGVELNADHIKSFSRYKTLRFDVSNGRTLCKPCHEKTLTYRIG